MNARQIPPTYQAAEWEDALYQQWEKNDFFRPEGGPQSNDHFHPPAHYSNILPPPNANGELHIGHASGYTVMDIFGRYQRMQGKQVLLLPGKDHAGIQTQVIFEKKLQRERGLSRFDIGREKFLEAIYAFCMERSTYMRSQEKKMGLAADWSREKFTLDPAVSRRALETFVKMHADGLLYRGERIINWCPRCATALSDIEVTRTETSGNLFFIKYALKNRPGFVTVATTRPETLLGDTAVAVHPDDERYSALVGQMLVLPLMDREIPLIADLRVTPDFGTGAVKITPAHDPLDWSIGHDHALATLVVIDEQARISALGGMYAGLTVKDAREKIIRDLTALGLLETQEHTLNLSQCERCKTTIEPLVSKQWFINVDAPRYSLKQQAIATLRSDSIVFHPAAMKDQMLQWFAALHDWCISRQIWWGHRLPVWYCDHCGDDRYVVSLEKPKTCPSCSHEKFTQDPDTLDTWFSSGQWPYTTLGYPDEDDAQRFYPTDMMVMGRDLLFFWAARMIMFGRYRTGVVPFRHLYFTGLVRDKAGQKMSKSKGNGINPLAMIEQYGADALRMALVIGSAPGNDIRLDEEKIKGFRNFTNKLWNIGRYVATASRPTNRRTPSSSADHWIIQRLQTVAAEVTRLIDTSQLSLTGEKLRDFTWNEFADWYVETHKIEKNDGVLRFVFETLLRLWHPFMPFVTEAIHQTLHDDHSTFLMRSSWPRLDPHAHTGADANQFEHLKNLIIQIRNIRALYRIAPTQPITMSFSRDSDALTERAIMDNKALFSRLARISEIQRAGKPIPRAILIQSGPLQCSLHLADTIDINKERVRFEKEKIQKIHFVTALEKKLGNSRFIERAQPEIIERERKKLREAKEQLAVLDFHLATLSQPNDH